MRKISNIVMLAALLMGTHFSVFSQALTTPAAPTGVGLTKAVVNLSKPNGGPFEPGDLLQIRATIYAPIGTTRYDEVRFQDVLPNEVTYEPDTRAIRNNEGKIILGNLANTGTVPNYNLLAGPFTESGAGSRGSYVAGTRTVNITIGSGATDAVGGVIGYNNTGTNGNYFPRQSSGLLIMATYHVTINSNIAPNTEINLGGGFIRLGNIGNATFTDYVFNPLPIIVFPASAGAPRLRSLNNITIATNGTFGRGTTRNGASLGTGTGLNLVTMANGPTGTDVGDGNYAVNKNTSRNDGPAGTLSSEMFNQNATGTIRGGLDVVGDHTGASDGAAGNAPSQAANTGGYLLMVNSANAPTTVFSENLTDLCPQSPYEISYWMRNLCPNCNSNGYNNGTTASTWNPATVPAGVATNRTEPGVLPNISVNIDGKSWAQSGNIAYDRPGNLNTYPDNDPTTGRLNTWKYKRLYLTTGALTTYAFALVNNAPGGGGNDWALDDIRVSQVVPDLLNLGDPLPPICPSTSVVLRTNISSLQITQATYNFYKWQRSTNNGSTWTDVAGSSSTVSGTSANNYIATLTVPGTETVLANNGVLYRVIAATSIANLGGTDVTGTCAALGAAFKLNIVNSPAFCRPPVANNINNESIPNTAGATAISPLEATDQDGSITNFTISSLPNAAHGVLRLLGTPVTLNQVLTPAEAAQLTFDPLSSFTGNASFTYFATDNSVFASNTAQFIIPVTGENVQVPIANNEGAVLTNSNIARNIPPLSGSVSGSGSISQFEVLSIPTVTQGVLTYFNGTADVAVTAGLLLSPAQAATLKFTPGVSAPNGTFNFTYRSRDNESQNSPAANYSITLISPGSNPSGITPPVAANIVNAEMSSNAVAQTLLPLAASDADGTISTYRFSSIPLLSQGSLQYRPGGVGALTAVTTALNLTHAEAASLVFTPDASFVGNIQLSYTALDNSGLTSAGAGMTIPVVNRPPIANPILTPALNRSDASRPIPGLSGYDGDGTIAAFRILTVPNGTTQGNLFYRLGGAGTLTQITAAITLTPAEANSLQFDPALSGTATVGSFTYSVTDNSGLQSAATDYTIPLQQYFPPVVQDVVFNRTESLAAAATPISFVPNTATWSTTAGTAVTNLNSPSATDVDGTIASYQILSIPDRGTNGAGRIRFPCDAACQALLPNLFTQGCNGATAGAFSTTFISGDDGCLPANTQYRVNGDNPTAYVEIVNASIPVSLSLAQMNGLQFNPRNPTQGQVFTFDYTAVDNDGYIGNTAKYFVPVTGTGLTTPPYALNLVSTEILNSATQATVPTLSANDNADGGTINRYEIQSVPTAEQGILYLCTPTCTAVTNGQIVSTANVANLRFTPSSSFTGTATFTYIAYDNDAVQKNSNIALVRIPVISSGLPAADGKEVVLVNSAPASAIPALTGSIVGAGSLQSFVIHNVPNSSTQGVLTYNNGTADVAVTADQALTLAEAATLKFDPVSGFAGNVLFKYSAQTFGGVLSNPATYTIKVTDPSPNAFSVVSSTISKASPATSLSGFPLNAIDNGSIVSYQINNIPPAAAGVLSICIGPCTPVTVGQVLTPAQISQMQFAPALGYTGSQAVFNYTATDNKGQKGNVASYSIPLSDPFSVSGTVLADGNGSTDNLVNGNGTNVSNQLYVSLIQAGVVVNTVAVAANGTYTLPNIAPGSYTVSVHNNASGSLTSVLPSGYVNTGEGTTAAGDGSVDGLISITISAASISGANFGVNGLPVTADYAGSGWSTPPGTDVENVPSAAFSATDPEDGTYSNNMNGRKVTLYPATGGTLYYNGVAVTGTLTITNFDNDLVDVDPTAPTGATTVSFQFAAWDNANLPDATPSTITMGFGGVVLPATGMVLVGEANDNFNQLNWKTASEINTESFTVQRSEDGATFTNVTVLPAAGNSQTATAYQYRDASLQNTVVYYRIMLRDVDGKIRYSNVVVIRRGAITSMLVFPNPIRDQFFITLSKKGEYRIDLRNIQGARMMTKDAVVSTSGMSIAFLRQGLPAGIYIISVLNNATGERYTQKIQFE